MSDLPMFVEIMIAQPWVCMQCSRRFPRVVKRCPNHSGHKGIWDQHPEIEAYLERYGR